MTVQDIGSIAYRHFDSPLGTMLLAAAGDGLAGAWFVGGQHAPEVADGWQHRPDHRLLLAAQEQLSAYFAGQRQEFTLPLARRGTAFQQAVWRAIACVPYGATASYLEIARRAGRAAAARAVGAATGRNPWSIIVPCHRIVGTGGALTGYAGGLQRKQAMLRLEARSQPGVFTLSAAATNAH